MKPAVLEGHTLLIIAHKLWGFRVLDVLLITTRDEQIAELKSLVNVV